jgi:hypothetical protein
VRVRLERPAERRKPLLSLDDRGDVTDLAALGVLGLDRHADRRGLVLGAHRFDRAGEGGREEGELARRRHRGEDRLHVGLEAHLEHAVGFVEHDRAEGAQIERAALQVVADPPRRTHQDVRTLPERALLQVARLSASEHEHTQPLVLPPELADLPCDLGPELTRRAQHQRLRHPGRELERLQDRQGEGCGLSAPGARLRDEILAGEQHGDAARLDVGHRHVPELGGDLDQGRGQLERAKVGRHVAAA